MEELHLEPFLQTPEVILNPDSGILSIIGKSYPEDAVEFYQPLFDWLEKYIERPAIQTHVVCEMEYLNSSSEKQLLEFLSICRKIKSQGNDLKISWRYEEGDDDIRGLGEFIENELEIKFNYQEV